MKPLSPARQAAEEAEARAYADAILSQGKTALYWRSLNTDIVVRWSHTALHRIKRRAWDIVGEHR